MEKEELTKQEKIEDEIEELEMQEALEEDDDISKKLEELNENVVVLQDKLLRSLAECENLRVRSHKMTEEARDYSIVSFAKDLLPVMDNLARALSHLPEEPSAEAKNIIDGVKMTKSELNNVFAKHGLELIEPQKGEKFDYNYHQAISQIMTDEFKEGSIVDIMQTGYKLKERLLRPAAVAVAKK